MTARSWSKSLIVQRVLGGVCVIADGRHQPGILAATPIRPRSRNKRAAAVRQNHKQLENTSPRQAPDDRKSASFKGMPFTFNDGRNLNVLVMGSLSCLRSTMSAKNGWSEFLEPPDRRSAHHPPDPANG